MSETFSLDIETRSLVPSMSAHAALEPWRIRQGKAEISSVSVCRPDHSVAQIVNEGRSDWPQQVRDLLRTLKGKEVYGHNTGFDVACMIATIERNKCRPVPQEVDEIRWRDTRLLTKWLINGQRAEEAKFRYSLSNVCATFLKDHPRLPEFLDVKGQVVVAGEDEEYWIGRGQLDVIMTKDLADSLRSKMPDEQRVGYITECGCIVPVANGQLNGIRILVENIDRVESYITEQMRVHAEAIGVSESVLNSPKQLGHLLYDQWGLKPLKWGANGGSTSKDDLLMIQYEQCQDDPILAQRMSHVMHFKKNSTLVSKYIKSLKEALSHTGDGYIYGIPRLFGTYTGRMTYATTTLPKKFRVSIALHQLPRPKGGKVIDVSKQVKMIRGLMAPPEGFGLLEFDASGQESRLMAIRSGDPAMIKVFRDGLNFHSMTGSAICGMDYDEFQEKYKEEEKTGGFHTEQRQLGKLTNLSCNYRIGGRALAKKAFVEYDTPMSEETGYFLTNTFGRKYRGVKDYWNEAIKFAKTMGYTECFGNRRYKTHLWDGSNAWRSESSAINFPIQGGGASMKEVSISLSHRMFPNVHFALDLHDATFNYCELDRLKEIEDEVREALNEIDYERFWGFKPVIPLTYESASGTTFEDVK